MQGDKDRGSHRIKRNVDKQRGKKSGEIERANKQPLLFVFEINASYQRFCSGIWEFSSNYCIFCQIKAIKIKVAFADKLINPDDEHSFTWKITVNKTMQFATVFLLLCK